MTFSHDHVETLRAFLAGAGYSVLEREATWWECLLVGPGERWSGRGTSADEAFLDAVGACFPSEVSRRLLAAALEARAAPASAEMAVEAAPAAAEPQPPAAVNEAEAPPPSPVEVAPAIAACPVIDTPPDAAPARFSAAAEREAEAAAALDALRELISRQQGALAAQAPQRQRLVLLGWLALARAGQEDCPGSPAIAARTTVIVRELRRLSEGWWPGMVSAFQLRARPAEACRELRGFTDQVPFRWREVAEAAAAALEQVEALDEAEGRDASGWADAAQLVPPPADPEALLADLRAELEEHGGDLFDRQPKQTPAPAGATLLGWARRLRWLRGSVDDLLWGAAMGRLRFWTQQALDPAQAREVLEPTFRPARPWSSLVRSEAEEAAEKAALAAVLASVPTEAEQLVGWLARALPLTTHHQQAIVEVARPLRAAILALPDEAIPGADRRIRRRLQKLKEALEETGDVGEPVNTRPAEEAEAPHGVEVPAELLARTAGRSALFVSNRVDVALQERLQSLLGFSALDWAESTPRRIEAAAEAIANGRYELVLGATGFLRHAADGTLSRACKGAGVAYVRVDRGRPAAVIHALERDGIAG